ncbi:hypothetical protein JCM8097_004007 [Rhodosporidiobolus ruineniae]
MPRSPAAGPVPAASTAEPDYFKSLKELEDWLHREQPPDDSFTPPPPPFVGSPAHEAHRTWVGKGKVAVCHDYKGGYVEADDERGYTFQHWHLIETFIYFSHNRVSCPPAGWIRAAHANGVKIFGTLIFEHDAGREDILELVAPHLSSSSSSPSSGSSSDPAPPSAASYPFASLYPYYADTLVALAQERGFDGWLINVEVDLGVGEAKGWAKEHAEGLKEWVQYLGEKMGAEVPGGEVMWYDSVTKDGKLAWQNRINEHNYGFFKAAGAAFLNYWWTPAEVDSTARYIDELVHKDARNDIYFGIDVFGRGSYGGGGFESWRALQAAGDLVYTDNSGAAPPSFSAAVFAPGWTVEAESLQHDLTTPAGYARWLADDNYLWSHGAATPSVGIEKKRMDRERRQRRGVHRARQLAASLAPSASPLPIPFRMLPPFDYTGPLDPLPGTGSYRPLSAFVRSPRPIPCPASTFYTNFSAGSGHAFFVEGKKVLDDSAGKGWTDVGFAFPQPSLVFHPSTQEEREKNGVEAEMVGDEAWKGPRALRLSRRSTQDGLPGEEGGGRAKAKVAICPVQLRLPQADDPPAELLLSVTYKPSTPSATSDPSPTLAPDLVSLAPQNAPVRPVWEAQHRPAANGWMTSSTVVALQPSRTATDAIFHLVLSVPASASVLIGSLSINSCIPPTVTRPELENLHYFEPEQALRWSVDPVSATLSRSPSSDDPFPLPPSPFFPFFHLFLRRSRSSEPAEAQETYLGTTFDREFRIDPRFREPKDEGEVVEVVVKGVRADGQLGTIEDGGAISLRIDDLLSS